MHQEATGDRAGTGQPSKKSVRRTALELLITASIALIWVAAAAFSLSVLREFLFFCLFLFVVVFLAFKLAYSRLTSKWAKALFVLFAIPLGGICHLLLVFAAGSLAGHMHVLRARQDAAPVLAYIDDEIRRTGRAPAGIMPGLNRVKDGSRMRQVFYVSENKDFDITILVTSFSYFDVHFIWTKYSSKVGSWERDRGKSPGKDSQGREVQHYYFDYNSNRFRPEKRIEGQG